MIRWLLLALVVGSLPLLSAGVDPGNEVVSAHGHGDALLQAAFLNHALGHAPWSAAFWNPPFFWPEPWGAVTMDPLLGQAALLKLVWWGAGSRPALDANLLMLLTLAGAFLATVAWARDWGASVWGASLAGAVYALGPFAAGHWHHLNLLPSPWLPLALWSLSRSARSRGHARWGWILLLCVCFAWQLLSSVYLTATLVLGLVVFGIVFRPHDRGGAMAWLVAGSVMAAWAIGWAQPFLEAARELEGYGRAAADTGPFQARLFDLLNAPSSHLLPWPGHEAARPALYPGLLWLGWAAVGLGALWRRGTGREAIALVVAAGLGLLLSFGRSHPFAGQEIPLPFAGLQELFWPLRALRDPSRFFLLAHLALALAAAFGMDALVSRRRWNVIGLPLLALTLLELAPGRTPRVRVLPDAPERQVLTWLEERPEPPVWMPLPAPCTEAQESALDARALLWAVRTGLPTAGGSSGFVPPSIGRLRAACCGGLDAGAVEALVEHGVDVLVVERARRRPWSKILERVAPRAWNERFALYETVDLASVLSDPGPTDRLGP